MGTWFCVVTEPGARVWRREETEGAARDGAPPACWRCGKPAFVRPVFQARWESCGRLRSGGASKPCMAFPRSVSVNRPPPPARLWRRGERGEEGKSGPPPCSDAAGCPTIADRELGRPNGRPGFELTPLLHARRLLTQRTRDGQCAPRAESCRRARSAAVHRCTR